MLPKDRSSTKLKHHETRNENYRMKVRTVSRARMREVKNPLRGAFLLAV